MYEGFLEFGDTEIINSARTAGYVSTAGCGVNWIQCPPCDGVNDALGQGEYIYANVQDAPWYDAQDEVTHRFLGVHGLRFEGLPGSTRTAEVTEGLLDGGVVGQVRNATRRVRVEAMLSAWGEDALEAGLSWLDAALRPERCHEGHIHNATCAGHADVSVFTACPPSPDEITKPTTVWGTPIVNLATNPSFEAATAATVEVRRNYDLNPRMDNNVTGWTVANGAVQTAVAGGSQLDFPTGVAMNSAFFYQTSAITPAVPGELWSGSYEVTVPAGFPAVTLRATLISYNGGASLGVIGNGPNVLIGPGETRRLVSQVSYTTPATTTGVRTILYPNVAIPSGARVIVRNAMIEKAPVSGLYFDGSTPVKLRRNLAINPNTDSTAGWGSNDGAQYPVAVDSTISRRSGTKSRRADRTATSPSTVLASLYSVGGGAWDASGRIRIQPGTTYTFSVWVSTNATSTPRAQLTVFWFDSGSLQVGSAIASPVNSYSVPAGTWFRIEFTATAPAGAAYVGIGGLTVNLPVGQVTQGGEKSWVTDAQIEEGSVATEYFDGTMPNTATQTTAWEGTVNASASYLTSPDFTYFWTGTANASASAQMGGDQPGVGNYSGDALVYQSVENAPAGEHVLACVFRTTPTNRLGFRYTAVSIPVGVTTVQGRIFVPSSAWPRASANLRVQMGASDVATILIPGLVADKWVDFTVPITTSAVNTIAYFSLNPATAWAYGDTIYFDRVTIIQGTYEGPYFDGSTPDTAPTTVAGAVLNDYAWTGTPHASTSTDTLGQIVYVPDPVAYADTIDALTRQLHTVTAVAGPTIVDKIHRGDAWGYVVEFVLVSAVPWLHGLTVPVGTDPTTPAVIQDVPFNLVPYPSAELALGTVIASTNYSSNPSVEVDATNWVHTSSGIVAGDLTSARSTALFSVGSAAFRGHFVASNTGTNGIIDVQNTSATFPAAVAGTRMSLNMWTNAQVVSGTAVIASVSVLAIWRVGTTVLRTDTVGSLPPPGGAISGKSLNPPATADNVIMRARAVLTSWSTAAVIDLYADAVAVTVP